MIAPEIGVTHLLTPPRCDRDRRRRLSPYVETRPTKAAFPRGALEQRGPAEAQISPWVSVGMLHQLSGRKTFATAAYINVADGRRRQPEPHPRDGESGGKYAGFRGRSPLLRYQRRNWS